ncbi:MAG TPA: hypothetical protein VEB67_02165 [Nitrososphaerales archaeon]|nr:hypothetical protein [Nitrososphaerales archaeon]
MLSQTSRQEILRRISLKAGYQVREESLTPPTRQAITNLATVQKHLFVVTELLRGEQGRVDRSLVLRAAEKVRKGPESKERADLAAEIGKLQVEIDIKAGELSNQILAEDKARASGVPPPEHIGEVDTVQLKCPNCSAMLPMPTGRYVKCQYCDTVLSVQEVTSQISSMIQKI